MWTIKEYYQPYESFFNFGNYLFIAHGQIISVWDVLHQRYKRHINTLEALDEDEEIFGKDERDVEKLFRTQVTKGVFNIGILFSDGSFDLLELVEYKVGQGYSQADTE